jgi:hypothetical protein
MPNGAREWTFVLDAPLRDGPYAQITLERWHQVHGLLDQGVGLLECAHRLQLALNTVKRYARADQPERMLRVPRYRASHVDPYRAYLRKRRAEDGVGHRPGIRVDHAFPLPGRGVLGQLPVVGRTRQTSG